MRCVILRFDAELSEGFGETEAEAKADALEQLPLIAGQDYEEGNLTFEYHSE